MRAVSYKYTPLLLLIIWITNTCWIVPQDDKYKAAMIYQFAQLIKWENKQENFKITIIGKSGLSTILEEVAELKEIDGNKIIITVVPTIESAEKCKILFLPHEASNDFELAYTKAKLCGAVLVTESKGLAKKGAGINFITVSGRINYEINKAEIESTGNQPSDYLIRLARNVY